MFENHDSEKERLSQFLKTDIIANQAENCENPRAIFPSRNATLSSSSDVENNTRSIRYWFIALIRKCYFGLTGVSRKYATSN